MREVQEMTSTRRTTIVATGCLLVSMTASVLLLRHLDKIRPEATIEDVLYINSPKVVKRASLGFDGLAACLYWTRTVQYFGHRHHDLEHTYNELAPLLEITTTLDPQMFPAYQFGASFLAPKPPNGAGQPERAIQLMEYGIQHNPDNWQLYYDLGFVYYTELKDYKKAAESFLARIGYSRRTSLHEVAGRADGGACRRLHDRAPAVERDVRIEQ